jgi:uroporphyrinogen-III synthase
MKSLAGRRVVVTRAAEQADPSAELITSVGAIPVVVPLVEIVDEPDELARLRALHLDAIEWLVVTSPNGARRVAPLLAPGSPRPLVAAVGAATAEVLPRCDLVAKTQSARGLLDDFPQGAGRVVVVQAVDAEPTLVDGLAERGWDVEAIKPFRAVTAKPSVEQQQAAMDADSVLFASGSAARGWAEIFGTRTPSISVAIGAQTAAAAEQVGLKITIVAADHSMYGMLVALDMYLFDCN